VTDVGDWTTQLRRGVLELAILSQLEQSVSYGYEIATRLASVPQLAAGEGTVYPLLRRLRRDGLLETYWQESAEGPPRQYYRLTAAGRRRLRTIEQEWHHVVQGVERLLRKEGRS
jgi:PadR family transcriptional regulator PadR